MNRQLPPLNALRAFEAAARHLSFTKAAEELNVTPAAVSHQVKALEQHLGCSLFRRLHNALELTVAGRRYAPLLSEGFDKLADAGDSLKPTDRRHTLTVSAVTSVATKWLAPRLSSFYQKHPTFDIRIDATDREVDFSREGIDLGILYGPGPFPGLDYETLFVDQVFPVCSPDIARSLKRVADLGNATLLHIDWANRHSSSPDWSAWLAAAGTTGFEASRGPRFTLSSMALDAAIAGEGVALGTNLFASDDIAAGRLVRPFSLGLPLSFPYQLVWPADAKAKAAAAAFRAWVLSEVAEYRNQTLTD